MGKVLSAQGSGYFPGCLLFSPPAGNTLFTASLTNMMGLYWRVKSWKIQASGSYTLEYSDGTVAQINSFIGSGELIRDNGDLESEQKLVCGASTSFSSSAISLIVDGYPSTLTTHFRLFSDGIFNSSSNISTSTIQIFENVGLITNDETGASRVGLFEVKLNGQTIIQDNLYTYIYPQYILTNQGLNIVIEPNEYWSYGGTYSTSTGLPL